jgi:copper oxidase (laccase) domain-containing protein
MNVLVATSTVNDGNMLLPDDFANIQVVDNRKSFLAKHGIDIKQATRVNVIHKGEDYCRYYELVEEHKGDGMEYDGIVASDALVTRLPNHALFLPIADCIGAVFFDPDNNILMLSHLGRHSLEQNGGSKSVEFLVEHYGSMPNNLKVWLTPAPGPDVYPLYKFDNRSLKNVLYQQIVDAGVLEKNVTDNPADTSKDMNYYSHSEFLKGNRTEDGRYAIVAMMTE